ncbi:Cell wall integrity and stress response component 3 [Meyerozyma sp. JA9]|nr:Cell wall integrity and stress response component 3 [Meyerozyma sp. JA9]
MKSRGHILLLCLATAVSASWTKGGCYKSSIKGSLSFSDNNMYQSSGHCEGQCSDSAYAVVTGGQYCYCGSTELDSSDETDSSNCNTPCQGYPFEMCGGDGYFLVYENDDVQPKAASSSSSSTSSTKSSTSTSSTKTSTSSTSSSSSTQASSTTSSSVTSDSSSSDASATESSDSPSASPTTVVSTVTGSDSQSVVEITKTIAPSTTAESQSSKTASPTTSSSSSASTTGESSNKGSSKSLSGGGIAGVVVGSLAGVSLIAGLLFFLWYKKRNSDEDHDDEFTLSGPAEKDQYSIGPNPFMANAAAGAGAGGAGAAGAGAVKGHGYHSSSGDSHSFDSTHNDEFLFERYPPMPQEAPNQTANFGRRRLSNGSLPDMITRNPNSLKVVNN